MTQSTKAKAKTVIDASGAAPDARRIAPHDADQTASPEPVQLASIERAACGYLDPAILDSVRQALIEDIGSGDVTTNLTVPAGARANGTIFAKDSGVLSGLDVAHAVFLYLDPHMDFKRWVPDRSEIRRTDRVLMMSGSARAILTGERTALNFLSRMSGIATLTRQFVNEVAGTRAKILDTRKTAPGLRAVDKLAVRHGGGLNHRFGLDDMILIKDNHIAKAGSVKKLVRLVRKSGTSLEIEVEVKNIKEFREALAAGVERILLDNMSVDDMDKAVRINMGRAKLEASGNVTLENVRDIAETGVDFISVGALTHSVKAFDFSLR